MKYATNKFWRSYDKRPLPWCMFHGSFGELKNYLEEKWGNYNAWSCGEDEYFVATDEGHFFKILHVFYYESEGYVNDFYWQKCSKEHVMQNVPSNRDWLVV